MDNKSARNQKKQPVKLSAEEFEQVSRADKQCEKFSRGNRINRVDICVMWVRSVMLRILKFCKRLICPRIVPLINPCHNRSV